MSRKNKRITAMPTITAATINATNKGKLWRSTAEAACGAAVGMGVGVEEGAFESSEVSAKEFVLS